jgi:DNA polymerase-3 subunit delta
MSRGALQALHKNIEQKNFERAYYLYGDEDFLKEATLQALIARAVDPATRDFNLDQRRSAGLDGASLGMLLGSPPMLADRRLIVLREVGGLKKDARAVLEQYLRKPAPDIVLVLVSSAGDKADSALMQLATAVEFAPLEGPRVAAWMMDHARNVHQARLSEEAAEFLAATVGSDLATLAAEIDKSVSYGGQDIELATVEAVIGVRHGETLGDLLEAVAQRQAATALRLVAPVLSQPKNGLVPTIWALGTQLLAIGIAAATRRTGASESALRGRMWELLRSGSINAGSPWGEAVDRWMRSVPLWSDADVQSGVRVLLAADRSAKDSRVATDEQILSSVVLSLCGDAQRVAA